MKLSQMKLSSNIQYSTGPGWRECSMLNEKEKTGKKEVTYAIFIFPVIIEG